MNISIVKILKIIHVDVAQQKNPADAKSHAADFNVISEKESKGIKLCPKTLKRPWLS